MKLRELSIFEFDNFAKNHPLGSYHQTSNYALNMSENNYDYDLLGLIDDNNEIVAASLILYRKIGLFYRYGYAPKGFLIDYYNPSIVKEFTTLLKKYYYKKNFAFIKINPEISIGQVDLKTKQIKYNENKIIESTLEGLNFKKLKGNKLFEAKIPKYNAILILKNCNLRTVDKRTRNKIRKSTKKGLTLEKGNRESIDILYKFIKNKKDYPITHYYNYYNAFSKNDSIDIFLVKIDFEESLLNIREQYEAESIHNNNLVEKLMKKNTPELLIRKMESDKNLQSLSDEIAYTTRCLANKKEDYIAGAITIKYKNRVNILISGYEKRYSRYNPNYFLHYEMIKYYKKDYDFMDLNGITGDFTDSNPYKGLNEFKFGFNPVAFENIGEFDYMVNESLYKNLDSNGALQKEFQRKEKKNPNNEENIENIKTKKKHS